MATKSSKKVTAASLAVGVLPKLTLNMPIDEKKAAAIQKCIAKGSLKITVNKVDLARGRIGDIWLYD
jgi:anti-sigma28 factor (negative regulator of flagellin synthesis)